MTKIPERYFQPSVTIGKAEVIESIVQEIKDQLAKRKIVKIKINKGIFERSQKQEVWAYICNETKLVLVSARGNVGVLWRE